ncbi:MAG: acylase [Acidobacteriota bacterium]
MRRLLAPALALLLTVGCAEPPPVSAPTEVLWDRWGIPHFFAPDLQSLSYVFGRAQAEAHGDLLLRLYGESRGRAAEYWGEEHLEHDRWVHTMGIPARGQEWYDAQAPPFRAALDSFARGINEWTEENRDALDPEVVQVLPVSGADVLGHVQRVLHFTFVISREEVAGVASRSLGDIGSNAWAISPRRTASQTAMLLSNPHLPWDGIFTWFEAHMVTPTVDLSGAALVGMPFLGIGFNDFMGWTHTVNTHDGADLYSLELDDGGANYRFDGVWRPLEVETVDLKVKRDGSTETETLEVKSSIHGPLVAERDGRALALRVVGLEASGLFAQYWAMSQATDLGDFEDAIRRLQMPLFTVMYADAAGHILHLFGGLVPRRPPGEWNWRGVVPGDTAETYWQETHGYNELPKAVDPPSGWLQNANDPPWTTSLPSPLRADRFPAYMAPTFMHLRAQQSALLVQGDEMLTYEQLLERKHSTEMRAAVRLLDDVKAAVGAHGDAKAREALAVLEAWDRRADASSRGAVLFEEIFRGLRRAQVLYAEAWDEENPLKTPDGFKDPARAAEVVSEAAAAVETAHGALDVPWGDVYRLRLGGHDLPASGGPGELGIFRVLAFEEQDDGARVATRGDAYVSLVEFGERRRSQAVLAYGNATQPGSKHIGDQLPLFARGEMRPVWRTRHEIETHLERRDAYGFDDEEETPPADGGDS